MEPLSQRAVDANTSQRVIPSADHILWMVHGRRQLSPLDGEFESDLAAAQEAHAKHRKAVKEAMAPFHYVPVVPVMEFEA